MNREQALRWLSEPRYERFLVASGGDHDAALTLYDWHEQLSTATFGLIHRFELLIRNSIDGALREGQPQDTLDDSWLLDFAILRPDGVRQAIVAIERLEKGKAVSHSRVVAGLSFAFWVDLLGRRYEELWRQKLHLVFSHGTATRKEISGWLRQIQRLRNRIAHHDSLLDQPVHSRIEDMLTVASWIEPDARAWLADGSDALAIAVARPQAVSSKRASCLPA